jgi:hypothetical protein
VMLRRIFMELAQCRHGRPFLVGVSTPTNGQCLAGGRSLCTRPRSPNHGWPLPQPRRLAILIATYLPPRLEIHGASRELGGLCGARVGVVSRYHVAA